MPTLVAPDGTPYETDNEDEIRNLTLGHGYRVLPEDTAEDAAETDDTEDGQDDEDDQPA